MAEHKESAKGEGVSKAKAARNPAPSKECNLRSLWEILIDLSSLGSSHASKPANYGSANGSILVRGHRSHSSRISRQWFKFIFESLLYVAHARFLSEYGRQHGLHKR